MLRLNIQNTQDDYANKQLIKKCQNYGKPKINILTDNKGKDLTKNVK
jgi:hypothetical protein